MGRGDEFLAECVKDVGLTNRWVGLSSMTVRLESLTYGLAPQWLVTPLELQAP